MSRPTLAEIRDVVDRTFSHEWDDALQSSARATVLEIIDRLALEKERNQSQIGTGPAREQQYGFAPRRIDSVRKVDLIEVVTAEGEGVADDPVRSVARLYRSNGTLVAIGLPSEAAT